MPDATGLHHLRWRKKKVDGFIIPANVFYGRAFHIPVEAPEIVVVQQAQPEPTPAVDHPSVEQEPLETGIRVSALSLKSIQAKRELLQSTQKANPQAEAHLPAEPFTETEMLLHWTKYAQKLGDKGHKIMESYMLINDPTLDGTTIVHELPNEGSRVDFEKELQSLAGYLRGKLHNHEIQIRLVVNESIESRKVFTPQDRYNRLNEINPALDLLRRTFDLDFNG